MTPTKSLEDVTKDIAQMALSGTAPYDPFTLLMDAHHYLVEYDQELSEKNPALAWCELKKMTGQPVWIELLNNDMWNDPPHRVDTEWWVIGEVRKDDIILATYLDEMELCEEDIGVLWKAYRKERK